MPPELPGQEAVERALAAQLAAGTATAVVIGLERLNEVLALVGARRARELAGELGQRLAAVSGGALVGRLAPYELAVAWPGAPGAELEALLAVLDLPLDVDGFALGIEAVVGLAASPEDGTAADDLLARAEIARHDGRGRLRRFEPAMERDALRRLTVLTDLGAALDADEQLLLHFQPVVDLATGGVDSVEALVRWDHPRGGFVPPGAFIPLAEQTGLIGPLTEHVLRLALDQCAQWHADGLDLAVAVNLSARNVTDPALPAFVAGELAARGLPGRALRLEITESVLMEQPALAVRTLEALREQGATIALDDFGTGYSSLAYLRDLPLDELKIDRSFVRALGESPRSHTVLRSVVGLAQELGLRTVAEGIEDDEALQRVAALGVSLAQGFHFARPLAAPGLRLWLDRRRPLLPVLIGRAAA